MGYKRYGSSDSIPTFNDDNNGEAVSNGILKNSSKKEIYFGIKKPKSAADSDKPWRELTTDDFDTQITSETGGCSATITKNNNDTTNKTGIIRYILSKNTTGSSRLITFKYNGTELFKINQDTDDNIYVYFRKWKVPVSHYEHYIVCTQTDFNIVFHNLDSIQGAIINTSKTTDVVLYHVTNNKDISNIFLNKTIKTLISNNTLTYVTGKEFSNDENELIEAPIKIIHMYRNVQLQLDDVTDNSKMYVYGGRQDSTQGDQIGFVFLTNELYNTIDWSNTINNDDVRSIGKYKLNSTTTYTVIWDLQNGNINGNTSSIQDIVNFGDTVSFSKYKPVRTNYIFNGWSRNISATSGSIVGHSAPITEHTTFYATWKKQLNKTVTFRFRNSITNIVIAWNDSSLPDVEFTIKIKDITNNSTFDITIPRNYQSSSYTTNKTFISRHQYQLVSCSPTKVGNTTYQVFTGVTSDM